MSQEEAREMKVQNMLKDVQDMARSGANPNSEKIRTIKEIVDAQLIPDLEATHQLEQKQVTENLKSMDTCNSNSEASQKTIADGVGNIVKTKGEEHAACREKEKEHRANSTSACQELDNFLNEIEVPMSLPSGRPREGMVTYVKSMSKYFCNKGPVCTDLNEKCKKAEEGHHKHSGSCNSKQTAFESGFCTWRQEISDTCSALGTCYKDALKIYTDHKADTMDLVRKWKVEYAALHKISCYVDVWLSDNNTATVDSSKFGKCEELVVDTKPMDIDFGTPAPQATCSMKDVEAYPGTDAFVKINYFDFKDYVIETVPCLSEPEAPVAAPAPSPVHY